MRINFNDARRASKQADLCDPARATCPATPRHAAAAGPRARRPSTFRPLFAVERIQTRPGAALRWVGCGSEPSRRPCERRQGLALLERYLAALEQKPVLIVPTRSDVEQVERELVARSGCVFGGSIGTFDDVFRRLADGGTGRVLTDCQQRLALRRAVARTSLNGLSVWRARAASPTCSRTRSASSNRPCCDLKRPTAISRASTPHTRPSSTHSTPRTASSSDPGRSSG